MLAPDPQTTITQLTDLINIRAAVTGWNQSLLNTVLPPLDPLPSWYTEINGLINNSKETATGWLTDKGPQAFAVLTQSYVDYANRFVSAARALQSLVDAAKSAGGQPSAAQLGQMQALIKTLQDLASQTNQQTSVVLSQLQANSTTLQALRASLNTAVDAAQAQTGQTTAAIQTLREQMATLQATIAVESNAISTTDIGINKTMVTGVIGMVFGFAVSGLTLGVGTIAGLVLGVGGSAISSALASAKLKVALAQYVTLASELAEDEMQLAMVQGVINSLERLEHAQSLGSSNITAAIDLWRDTRNDLDWLQVVLQQPQIDVSLIPALNDLPTASTVWTRIATFAQQVQNLQLTSQVVSLDETVVPAKLTVVR